MSISENTIFRLDGVEPLASSAPQSSLASKLAHQVDLPVAERVIFEQALRANVRTLAPRAALVDEGAPVSEISIVLDGWAARTARLEQKRRQIVALYLPGDICDFNAFMLNGSDQSISAITSLRVAGISRAALNTLSQRCPRLTHGLWWESACSAAVQRRWTVNLAQRSAKRRLAHLLCELFARLEAVGMARGTRCTIPISQSDLGNACGLTPEHTSRTLQELRVGDLLSFNENVLDIHAPEALAELGCFDPSYLQFVRPNVAPALDLTDGVFAA